MSDVEIVAPNANEDSQLTEISKSNQAEAPAQSTERTDVIGIEKSTTAASESQDEPTQTTENPPSTETAKDSATQSQSEIVAENVIAPVVEATDASKTQKPTNEEANGDTEKVSNVGKLESMGAGDPCSQKVENAPTIVSNEASVETTDSNVNNNTSQIDKSPPVKPTEANLNEQTISKLQTAMQKMAQERDSYKKKLDGTEKKLAALQTSYDDLIKGGGDEITLRRMMEQLKAKLIQTSLQLEDRVRIVANQEKQISALNNQVASLKEVEALTRSLLQIRNMEVKHLQAEVDAMEVRITEERERYNTMINKMDSAVKLNADLKKEYETQLGLFRDLREKYEEKVTLLSEEKRALETAAQTVPE